MTIVEFEKMTPEERERMSPADWIRVLSDLCFDTHGYMSGSIDPRNEQLEKIRDVTRMARRVADQIGS